MSESKRGSPSASVVRRDGVGGARLPRQDRLPLDPLARGLGEAWLAADTLADPTAPRPSLDDYTAFAEDIAAALRNHPDRLRIAASLLTAEDVERIAAMRVGLMSPAAILAALSGEHSDD